MAHPPSYDQLVQTLAARDRRIAELEASLTQLQSRVLQLEQLLAKASRSGKRQAAPFSKGPPVANPKRPGRKGGDDYGPQAFRAALPPAVIDEVHDASLPERCPHCGGTTALSHIAAQYQTEIPRRAIHRQFNIAVGHCTCCRKRVQGRHPLQTSDALGCCASQLGPEAQAATVMLNKAMGLSHGKVQRCFESLFGIRLSRGGSCQAMLRAADRLRATHQAIVRRVQASPWLVPDETGWRIGGRSAWLHAAVGEGAVAYLVHPKRGFEASSLLIGADYAGTLIHDGWSPYDRFEAADHQTCLAHLLRRCGALLETATGGAVRFPRQIKALLQDALAARDRLEAGRIQPSTAARHASRLQQQTDPLTERLKTHPGNDRFAAHLWRHRDQLFTFLRVPGVDATNWRAEQALRPAVVNRKVWGGNRTAAGAEAQGILLSVLGTARLAQVEVMAFLAKVLQALPGDRPWLLPVPSG